MISTSVGAEGIEYTHNKNIIIANTPAEYLEAIEKIKNNKEFSKEISVNAIDLIKRKYDNKRIVSSLLDNYKNLISQSG